MKIEKFGEIVKSLRKKKKLTVSQLSALSGVPFHVLGTIERGQNWPSSQWLSPLSQALKVSISSLFEEEGSLKPIFRSQENIPFSRTFKNTVEEILLSYAKLETLCGLKCGLGFPFKIPFLKGGNNFIEEAAVQSRELLGMRELVGFDLLNLLEESGINVIVCHFLKEQNDFSCFHPRLNAPVFFMNIKNSSEKKMVSLAYELGYQIFQKERGCLFDDFSVTENDPLEEVCERFAPSFLIPEKKLKKIFEQLGLHPHLLDYDLLLHLKNRFVVPAEIFISRLWELEMISKKQKELFLSLLKPESPGFTEPLPSLLTLNENQRIKEMILMGLKNDSHGEEIRRIEVKLKGLGVVL